MDKQPLSQTQQQVVTPRLTDWLEAFRLRTLPLGLSTIIVGNVLAMKHQSIDKWIFGLSILTTVGLQILSNLANDYGDTVHGADSHERVGPQRTVQKGTISLKQMKKGIIFCTTLTFLSGTTLVLLSFPHHWTLVSVFIGLGVCAIWAAINYTAGHTVYGYHGIGDVAVFVFFGPVGVLGTVFLHTQQVHPLDILPAIALGTLSSAVLNINNMRDIQNDKNFNKKTIPVRLGFQKSKIYHAVLLLTAFLTLLVYLVKTDTVTLVALSPFLIIAKQLKDIFAEKKPQHLDPFLKTTSLAILSIVLILWGVQSLMI